MAVASRGAAMLDARRAASQLRLSSWRRRKREQVRAVSMAWGRVLGCSDMAEADW